MKRRANQTRFRDSWDAYEENFSDLLMRSGSPKVKVRKKSRCLQSHEQGQCTSPFVSQDGIISWSSSEEDAQEDKTLVKCIEKDNSNDLCLSPVMHGPGNMNQETFGSLVKSAPSGSPILTQNRFSTIRKRSRKPSLLPISPITPDCSTTSFFTNVSHFSISAHEESSVLRSDLDATPLALPLVYSDDELNQSKTTDQSNENQTQPDIDSFCTQSAKECDLPSQDFENPENSILDLPSTAESFVDAASDNVTAATSNARKVKGSAWIETIIDKLDEDSVHPRISDNPEIMTLVRCDSAKKGKFVKDGLAEQLQHVMRQQKTQKVLFQHQIKEASHSDKEAFECRMKLKVLSHHREGALHVLECRVLGRGKQLSNTGDFFTLLLQHEVVVENKLKLSSEFTIYPPWKTVDLVDSIFPVLLCVDHIKVESESNQEVQPDTETAKKAHEGADADKLVACESLLQALEQAQRGNEVTIAATVQRIYCNICKDCRWTLLCEDAFGVFFETEIDAALAAEDEWQAFIKHSEGQRILFQRLALKGRHTRAKSPHLFTLIDSVWNEEGFGLLQVDNSQSQSDTLESNSQITLRAPSFAYQLLARHGQSSCTQSSTDASKKCIWSQLNRPSADGTTRTDVLYTPARLSTGTKTNAFCPNAARLSLTCKVLHCCHGLLDEEMTSRPGDEDSYVTAFVVDEQRHLTRVHCSCRHAAKRKLQPRNVVLLKDGLRHADDQLFLDTYSRVLLLAGKDVTEAPLPHVFPNYKQASLSLLRDAALAPLPFLSRDSKPGSFVIIRGAVQTMSRAKLSSHQSAGRITDDVSVHEQDCESLQVTISTAERLSVKVKLRETTSWRLVSHILPLQKVDATLLAGTKLGPLLCFLTSAPSGLASTFSAQEID